MYLALDTIKVRLILIILMIMQDPKVFSIKLLNLVKSMMNYYPYMSHSDINNVYIYILFLIYFYSLRKIINIFFIIKYSIKFKKVLIL